LKLLNDNTMKHWSKLIPALFVLLTGLLFSQRADAQCGIKVVGASSGCAPFLGTFQRTDGSGKTVSSVTWNYTLGSYTTTDTIVQLNFKTPGTYSVSITVTYSDGTKCNFTLSTSIIAFGPPKAVLNLPTNPVLGPVQCFKRNGQLNNYTFTQSSSPGTSGAGIVRYVWNFGDGDTSNSKTPTHSYQAPGTYNISLRVVDANGCEGYDTILGNIIVLKDIKTSFTMNSTRACNKDSIQFNNNTDTTGLKMKAFYWDFGDGSPIDSTNYNPSKIYKPGVYHISLTIENILGCTATDTQTINVVRFRMKIYFKDTMCWASAEHNGVVFSAEQQPGAVFWQWNFGDPNSGQLNVSNFNWVASHKFVGGPSAGGTPASSGYGGPGIYIINFTVSSATCGTLDTCFYVHILGPMAMVSLPPPPGPFPANNLVPPQPIPHSAFVAINGNKSSCLPQTITYLHYRKLTPGPTAHWTYKYCNADTLKGVKGKHNNVKLVDSTAMGGCKFAPVIPYAYSVTLKPTDSSVSYYRDSTTDTIVWTRGNSIPTAKVYYEGGGTYDFNDMADSNMITCTLPNLVRFTNNSIKWRLHYAIDDNTFQNVIDPRNSFEDTCRWKNWPMASDSLIYYWRFNDPGGKPCTMTNKNKDSIPGVWNCNFSTLAAPYHYYKGASGTPPSGCQDVNMLVRDPVTGCSDSLSPPLLLVQGPPQAGWNKAAYCKMTWEMQQYQLVPKGSPGPDGPPLIGFMLTNQPNACAGPAYQFRIDFEQTIPTCGAQNWWAVFDSAHVTKYRHCTNPNDSVLDYGFTGDLGPGYSPAQNGYPSGAPAAFWQGIPWFGNYWYNVGDSGCKTIGIVLQVGNCFDTAWYHDYICFNKLDAYFDIFSVVPPDTGSASQANPYYGQGGGPTIPGDSGIGYTQVFVDSSENQHGHICQPAPTVNWTPLSKGGTYDYSTLHPYINEGLRLYLFPRDTNMSDVTAFKYNITRNNYGDNPSYTNSGGQWYYNMPHDGVSGFFPDSAVLNPFTTANDSVAQIKFHVNYIDTPYLYIIIPTTKATVGLPPKRILFNFPIYGTDTSGELDSLITRGHVNIPINDSRSRRIDAVCGKPYVTVYVDPGFKVLSQTQILRLGGFKAVDSFMTPGQIPHLTIPYPGFYTINAFSTNLEGCEQSSTYYLVYGHYATFWVNDSVICLGQPTYLHWYVRYWSTNCPPPPGGGPPPPGCLNGADEEAGINPGVDFNPWDSTGIPGGPTAYRDSLTANAFKNNTPAGYQPEQIWFNMGEGNDTLFHRIVARGNMYGPYTYTHPGVYTVTLKTVDWRGCNVFTQRLNLMKVIQVKANFNLKNATDALSFCPPKSIPFLDSTTIAGNKYTQKVVKNGQIIDSTYIVDSIATQIWTTGSGKPITRTGTLTEYLADYPKAGKFDVNLAVKSTIGCSDDMLRKQFITVIGATPKFEVIGNSSGCFPFKVHLHITSHDSEAKIHVWNFGDYPKLTNPLDNPETESKQVATSVPGPDSIIYLTYNLDSAGGRFRLHLTETDSFTDITGKSIPCTVDYPLPTDSQQIFITVYPNSPITIHGDTLLCVDKVGSFTVTSKYHEYKTYAWWVSNPNALPAHDTTYNGDSLNTILFSKADYNTGTPDKNGNVMFTIHVHAESDTGKGPTGCTRDTIYRVYVQDSRAGFTTDSSQANIAKFTFHDTSLNAIHYVLDYGDGDSITTLTPGFTVSHTYTNLNANPTPEGIPQAPIKTFTVTLKTVSSNGCPDQISHVITLLREFQHYNVFTPNGDTANPRFAPFVKGQTSASLKIYNRWGQEVFESKGSNDDTNWSKDPANTWDGTDMNSGQPCPVGTYYYIWHFTLIGGQTETINGAVTLIR